MLARINEQFEQPDNLDRYAIAKRSRLRWNGSRLCKYGFSVARTAIAATFVTLSMRCGFGVAFFIAAIAGTFSITRTHFATNSVFAPDGDSDIDRECLFIAIRHFGMETERPER